MLFFFFCPYRLCPPHLILICAPLNPPLLICPPFNPPLLTCVRLPFNPPLLTCALLFSSLLTYALPFIPISSLMPPIYSHLLTMPPPHLILFSSPITSSPVYSPISLPIASFNPILLAYSTIKSPLSSPLPLLNLHHFFLLKNLKSKSSIKLT